MLGSEIGPYKVIEKLGAGGMGEVYRARDTTLDRDVALKVLPEGFTADAERLQRFEREARTLASLNHANIAQVYGLERADSIVIVMEMVEGEDLAERLARGPLPLDEALPVARQVAAALEAAHAAGVVHRDLKPANVKVRHDGTVKVLDFGLAKPNATRAASSVETGAPTTVADSPTMLNPTLTGAGTILGSAAYMSPEQARGRPVDHRADVWAFGCLLFEILSGQRAFDGEDASMTLASVLKRDIDFDALPGDTPPELRRMIERCLETDPGRRYQAMGDARIDIERWLTDGFVPRAATPPAEVAAAPWWQQPGVVAAAMLLFAALGYGAARLTAPEPPAGSVTRLALARDRHADIALSRDGLLAIADDEGLWIKVRSEERPRLLPAAGVEVDSPFFSPDGQWVGYFTANQLRKVPIDGGASLPINTVPIPFRFCGDAAWGAGGQVVFACSDSDGLWSVPAAGGEQRQLTLRNGDERMHGAPSFLPDERTVIFGIGVRNGEAGRREFDLAAVPVDADPDAFGDVRRLGLRGSEPRYLPTGHLVFARDQSLWAAPFDPVGLAVTGEAVPVVEGVTEPSQFGAAYYAVGADGSLAYWSGRYVRVAPTYPVVVGRNGGLVAEFPELLGAQRSRFSPDGRRLVLDDGGSESVEPAVSVVDVVRGAVSRVGTGYALGWSPDGAAVIYGLGGDDGFTIYRRPWDLSADPEPVATLRAYTGALSWMPDGNAFVFANPRGNRERGISSDIGTWTAPGDIEWVLDSQAQEAAPALSPDGHWLAYQYTEGDTQQDTQVFIRPYPGPGGQLQVSIDGGRMPRWSADGRQIYFWHDDSVWETPFDPGGEEPIGQSARLFTRTDVGTRRGTQFDVSPDGTHFVVHARQQTSDQPPVLHLVYGWSSELQSRLSADR